MSHKAQRNAQKRKSRFRKAPGAPKRFKSAYIFFSTDMMQRIKKQQKTSGSDKQKVTFFSNDSSITRKNMPSLTHDFTPLLLQRLLISQRRFLRFGKIYLQKKDRSGMPLPRKIKSASQRRKKITKDHGNFLSDLKIR